MALTKFQGGDPAFQLMQTSWANDLNPLLLNPLNQCLILRNISLLASASPNVVNHKLGRTLQGWLVIGMNNGALIYDKQANNQTPQLTLNLITSANVVVNLAVF